MSYVFSLVLALGLLATAWAIGQAAARPMSQGLEALKQWRQWHRHSAALSRPLAQAAFSGQKDPLASSGLRDPLASSGQTASFAFALMKRLAARRHLAAIEKATPELLSFLARAIRAGHSLPTAVLWAGETFPGAMGEAFSRIRSQLQCGLSLNDALSDFALRYPLAELRMLVLGLRIAQDLGGPLPDLLEQLAANSRARLRLRARVKALSSEARWSGWFLAFLPILLAAGLSVWRPEHMAILWSYPRGQALSLAAVALSLLGSLWMRHLVQQVDR